MLHAHRNTYLQTTLLVGGYKHGDGEKLKGLYTENLTKSIYIYIFFHVCASTVSKHFLLFHNDAHNYKITGILKQSEFRRSLRHVSVHAGTIIREPFLCLAKRLQLWFYPRRL
jgi:hypothetical protein